MADLKFDILLSKKNSNNVFLSEVKYNKVLEEVKRLKNGAKLKKQKEKTIIIKLVLLEGKLQQLYSRNQFEICRVVCPD